MTLNGVTKLASFAQASLSTPDFSIQNTTYHLIKFMYNIKNYLTYIISYFILLPMAIEVNLDMMLVKRKMKLNELSERIGISVTNLSLLKTGKVKGMRFSTLEAICRELECQPGDILEYVPDYI